MVLEICANGTFLLVKGSGEGFTLISGCFVACLMLTNRPLESVAPSLRWFLHKLYCSFTKQKGWEIPWMNIYSLKKCNMALKRHLKNPCLNEFLGGDWRPTQETSVRTGSVLCRNYLWPSTTAGLGCPRAATNSGLFLCTPGDHWSVYLWKAWLLC